MPTYVRRLDQELVEAVQWTGKNADEVRALVGAGYRVEQDGFASLTLTRDHPEGRVLLGPLDWVLSDGLRIYGLPPYAFWSHCRGVRVE